VTDGPGRHAGPSSSAQSDAHVIEALEPAGGRLGGFRVEVEGERPFRVPEDLCRSLDLRPGVRFSRAELDTVIAAAAEREAMDRAVLYLSHRPRTCREVLRHLSEHGLSGYADSAITRCREIGYLDDERYAEAFARERLRLKPRGSVRLISELLARGVDRPIAERAVGSVMREEGLTETSVLRDLAAARARRLGDLDPPVARRRLSAWLARRGFAAGEIRAVVLELVPDERDG